MCMLHCPASFFASISFPCPFFVFFFYTLTIIFIFSLLLPYCLVFEIGKNFNYKCSYFLFSLQVEGLFEDIDFKAKITRSEFEEMCSDLFDQIAHPVEQALRVADITLVCIIMSCHMTIV